MVFMPSISTPSLRFQMRILALLHVAAVATCNAHFKFESDRGDTSATTSLTADTPMKRNVRHVMSTPSMETLRKHLNSGKLIMTSNNAYKVETRAAVQLEFIDALKTIEIPYQPTTNEGAARPAFKRNRAVTEARLPANETAVRHKWTDIWDLNDQVAGITEASTEEEREHAQKGVYRYIAAENLVFTIEHRDHAWEIEVAKGQVLYIGKAKNLYHRLRSHGSGKRQFIDKALRCFRRKSVEDRHWITVTLTFEAEPPFRIESADSGTGAKVVSVVPGSEAETKGVRVEQLVLEVGGEDVTTFSVEDIRTRIESGQEITFGKKQMIVVEWITVNQFKKAVLDSPIVDNFTRRRRIETIDHTDLEHILLSQYVKQYGCMPAFNIRRDNKDFDKLADMYGKVSLKAGPDMVHARRTKRMTSIADTMDAAGVTSYSWRYAKRVPNASDVHGKNIVPGKRKRRPRFKNLNLESLAAAMESVGVACPETNDEDLCDSLNEDKDDAETRLFNVRCDCDHTPDRKAKRQRCAE